MDIQKYEGMKIYPKTDDKVFKILVRTLKDFGFINRFKSLDELKTICYDSRYSHLHPNGSETYFQNMLFWVKDLYAGIGTGSPTNYDWATDTEKRLISIVFSSRLINSGVIESTDYHKALTGKYFIETYINRLNEAAFVFASTSFIKEWPIFDEEIEIAIDKLTIVLLPEYASSYKDPIEHYRETRRNAIFSKYFKPLC